MKQWKFLGASVTTGSVLKGILPLSSYSFELGSSLHVWVTDTVKTEFGWINKAIFSSESEHKGKMEKNKLKSRPSRKMFQFKKKNRPCVKQESFGCGWKYPLRNSVSYGCFTSLFTVAWNNYTPRWLGGFTGLSGVVLPQHHSWDDGFICVMVTSELVDFLPVDQTLSKFFDCLDLACSPKPLHPWETVLVEAAEPASVTHLVKSPYTNTLKIWG